MSKLCQILCPSRYHHRWTWTCPPLHHGTRDHITLYHTKKMGFKLTQAQYGSKASTECFGSRQSNFNHIVQCLQLCDQSAIFWSSSWSLMYDYILSLTDNIPIEKLWTVTTENGSICSVTRSGTHCNSCKVSWGLEWVHLASQYIKKKVLFMFLFQSIDDLVIHMISLE